MDNFQIDYENLDVEAIMAQVRQRVKEKKGIVYQQADLDSLGSLELPSPKPPEKMKVEGYPEYKPDIEEPIKAVAREIESLDLLITERMKDTRFQEIQDEDFVTEALNCVGEWNINITREDLYRSTPGIKGKIISGIRSINRKLFKMVMNIDVLFPQFHRQAVLNQTYVQLFHTIVREMGNLFQEMNAREEMIAHDIKNISHLTGNINDINKEITNIDYDLKKTRKEILEDMANDKNAFRAAITTQNEIIAELQYKIDALMPLKGIIESQKQEIEYLKARQDSLEKLAVLKPQAEEEKKGRKSSDLEKGRYQEEHGEEGK